jgi:hypothetical protein
MKDKNVVLELWSDGGLERRPPARRCVRRGHLFGVHASACSDAPGGGNMLKHGHQTVTRRLFGVHALACSDTPDGGNMLKHAHQTVTRPLMKHRTPNFERRTLNCGMGLRARQENGCSTFSVGCSKLPFRAQSAMLACENAVTQHPETSIFRKSLRFRKIS